MRNIFIVLALITFSSCAKSQAVKTRYFTKYSGNPIILKGAGVSWETGDLAGIDLFRDTLNHRYAMNYSAYGTVTGDASPKWRMCLAYSTDLINWAKDPLNPIFSPISGEGYISCNSSIVFKNGLYYHFYQTGLSNDAVSTTIRLATSPDLHTWTRQNGGNSILPKGATGSLDDASVYDPCVNLMPDGVTFEMYYSGLRYDGSGTSTTIMRVTSTDGINWSNKTPFLKQQTWWNKSNFGSASVHRLPTGSIFMLWDAAVVPQYRKIAGALSNDDGKTWRYYGFLLEAEGTGWESAQDLDSNWMLVGDTIYIYYSGGDMASGTEGMNAQIGVATGKLIKQ